MKTQSIAEMLFDLKSGRTTARQLVEAALERSKRCKAELNAFATISDTAMEAAAESDRRYSRGEARMLEGIPLAVKDIIDTAGIETRYGSAAYVGNVPARDATVVHRLRDAGAVVVGKTTTHEFAWGVTTSSAAFGDTRNPVDRSRIPGGSSGGAAAAVAYGAVPAGLGTDTGGSVRIPSALCGVVALKPTYGMLPTDGVFPLAPTLDHVGLICRTAEDLPILAQAVGVKLKSGTRSLKRRFGVFRTLGAVPVEEEIARDFKSVTDDLARKHAIVEVDAKLDEAYSIIRTLILTEGGVTHFARSPASLISQRYGQETIERLKLARLIRIDQFARAQEERRQFNSGLASLFDQIDFLILPTCPCSAPLIGEKRVKIGEWTGDIRQALMAFTAPFNLTGHPVATVPLPRKSGALPAGLQIVGRQGHDAEVIEAAIEMEKRCAVDSQLTS